MIRMELLETSKQVWHCLKNNHTLTLESIYIEKLKDNTERKRCKICKRDYDKKYRELKKDSIGQYKKEYQIKNKEKIREIAKQYYLQNKIKIIAKVKKQKEIERFNGLREQIILRDKEQCVTCGMTRQQHKEIYHCDITVNHIDGTGRNKKITNNNISNLETLCLKCHGSKDGKRGTFHKNREDDNYKEWLNNVSKSWYKKGRIVSTEERERNRKRMLVNNPFKGKKHTKETKRIMREKAIARWQYE